MLQSLHTRPPTPPHQIVPLADNPQLALAFQPSASLSHTNERGQPLTIPEDMSHPYYWAPFILIGNGL